MWRWGLRPAGESRIEAAQAFLASWELSIAGGGELRLFLRGNTLNLPVLEDLLERLAACRALAGTRFVFDFSSVEELESCYSVICAFFVRFVCLVGERCRIVGLNPRLDDVFGFFLRRLACIELEPAANRRPLPLAAASVTCGEPASAGDNPEPIRTSATAA